MDPGENLNKTIIDQNSKSKPSDITEKNKKLFTVVTILVLTVFLFLSVVVYVTRGTNKHVQNNKDDEQKSQSATQNHSGLVQFTSSDMELAPLSILYPESLRTEEQITATTSRFSFESPEADASPISDFRMVVTLSSVEKSYRKYDNFKLGAEEYFEPHKVKVGYQQDKNHIPSGQQVARVLSSSAVNVGQYDAWMVDMDVYNQNNIKDNNRTGQVYYVYFSGYAQAVVEFSAPNKDDDNMRQVDTIINSLRYGQAVEGS